MLIGQYFFLTVQYPFFTLYQRTLKLNLSVYCNLLNIILIVLFSKIRKMQDRNASRTRLKEKSLRKKISKSHRNSKRNFVLFLKRYIIFYGILNDNCKGIDSDQYTGE